jgi:nucleotide-binding universal stress UspA family protein
MSAYQVCPTARLEKLLVPTDGSEFSESAIKEALTFAKACSSKIYALSVIEVNPEFEALAPGFVERAKKTASEHLESIKSKASNEDIDCEILIREGEEPYKYIVEEAKKNKIEMIIMGRHGRTGLKRLMIGSVTAKVIGHMPCNVLIVPKASSVIYKTILLATDGSKYSEAAALDAISIAKRCRSDLIVLSVSTKTKNIPSAKKSVEKIKEKAEKDGLKVKTFTPRGMPYELVVKTAKDKKAGVIVVGSHGRTGLKKLLMGSVTERIIGHAHCPVLVVKS